ncbi:outer membrane biogenesis protein BamB [Maioricimonas rarisocia]|uniref:Outer membrane biogenesis protein BamB n=1 Tax=Maioricimonas rarisocia TaxID=2528026 RepID=A0A517Z1Q8_9PLAN|nr:PQQ-binding-like beta-propeller repeat protein [Maioricimonas rarisocia]QDU36426.1 outer membrane biogenesis protein BamB [Maioricimonas rarisocia]
MLSPARSPLRFFVPVAGVFVILATTFVLEAGDPQSGWTEWRGPRRDGTVVDSTAWPDALGEEQLKLEWRTDLGPSYSGPIVADGRVYVTETVGEKEEVVRAFDVATGEALWEARWQGAMSVPFFARANGSWIRATPAYDEGRLFVAGIRDVLVCLDAGTGDQLWRVDLVDEFESDLPAFGFASSPLVRGEAVYVQAGGGLVKLDKRSGEVLWRSLSDGGGMTGSAFSSPILATLHGREQLVVQTRTELVGVDPSTGAELWSREIPAFRGMNILTPTVVGDTVFTSTYGGSTWLFDVNSDGMDWSLDAAWKNKLQGYMSSPVVIDGHAYLHMRNQRLACVDLANGEIRWTTTPFGKYWSMVANGDRILALDQNGELRLIEATPEEYRLIDSRKVSDDSWAHVAVAGGRVFVRELDDLAVYHWAE